MKRALLILFFYTVSAYSFQGVYEYAGVGISSAGDLEFLQLNGINIDRTSIGQGGKINGGSVTVHVSQEQFDLITNSGYTVGWTPLILPEDKSSYRYNEAIGDSMLIWQERHPDICRRLSIGTSVQGRPLWVLKISPDPEGLPQVPAVKFVGTMHGDEVVGLEMQMFMIENILKGYKAANDSMRFLVDNTEMYFMPLMNPDGMALGRRNNANGYDLNRNFPEGTSGHTDSVNPALLPEIQAMIDFTAQRNFIISANFHGGALVANYPYDYDTGAPNFSYAACPDDQHVTWMAYNYSARNRPMFESTSFENGITNGSEWYQITGGMQDWNYRYHNCSDITLEISGTKWPSYTTIPAFWADNRESMFWYMNAVHRGIKGRVTAAATEQPLHANIEIEGIDKTYFSRPEHGDFYRVLKPGTYNLTVSAEGYETKYLEGIEVKDSLATVVEVALDTCVSISGNGKIPENIFLEQNYPNPFNPVTIISFYLNYGEFLNLSVYDIKGNLVEVLAEKHFTKGKHSFEFDARELTSGIYFYTLRNDPGNEISGKMSLIK